MSNTTRIKDLKPQPNTPAPTDDAPLKNRIEHLLQSKKAAINAMLPKHLGLQQHLQLRIEVDGGALHMFMLT